VSLVHAYPVDHVTLPTLVARNSPLSAATLRRHLLSFVAYDSAVVFSGGLYTASGERIAMHEFQTKPHRVLAPTLCIVIPDSSSCCLPSFALTVASPISPTHPSSPILPAPSHFTRESYLAAAASAPPSSRVPSLPPRRCPQFLYLLSRSRCCERCELQQLACEI
jgi:hypothetical protein